MRNKIKLERRIAELEKRLDTGNFRGLVDRENLKRDEDKLKKLRKELENFPAAE